MEAATKGEKQFAGIFTNYINTEAKVSVATEIALREVQKHIQNAAKKFGMQAKWYGSFKNKTFVEGYSDIDLLIVSNEKIVSQEQRKNIAELAVKNLETSTIIKQPIKQPEFNKFATRISLKEFHVDLVFPAGEWCQPNSLQDPESEEFLEQFVRKPWRQRAVKSLKLLSKKHTGNAPKHFPRILGRHLERLVIATGRESSKAEGEGPNLDQSGLLLFRNALAIFAEAKNAAALVRFVEKWVPYSSEMERWFFGPTKFGRWKKNAKIILANIAEACNKPKVSRQDVEDALKVPDKNSQTSEGGSQEVPEPVVEGNKKSNRKKLENDPKGKGTKVEQPTTNSRNKANLAVSIKTPAVQQWKAKREKGSEQASEAAEDSKEPLPKSTTEVEEMNQIKKAPARKRTKNEKALPAKQAWVVKKDPANK